MDLPVCILIVFYGRTFVEVFPRLASFKYYTATLVTVIYVPHEPEFKVRVHMLSIEQDHIFS